MEEEKSLGHLVVCPRCGKETRSLGPQSPRMGEKRMEIGFLGPMIPMGTAAPFNVYICPWCSRIELYADEDTTDVLLEEVPKTGWKGDTPNIFLKRCIACKKDIPIVAEECGHFGARQSKN